MVFSFLRSSRYISPDICVILSFSAPSGSTLSLDLREQFGERVEIECFHFIIPPVEFRLVRNSNALQEWQPENTEMYDCSTALG
jgi:hypothetical protein